MFCKEGQRQRDEKVPRVQASQVEVGFRIAGKDGDQVRERVLNRLDRTIRRLITVAKRIDDSLEV